MILFGMQSERREMLLSGYQTGLHKGGGGGGNNGAAEQAAAQQDAINLQRDQWNQTQQQLAPYLNAGSQGLSPLLQAIQQQGGNVAAQTGAQNSAFQALQNLSSSSGQNNFLSNYYNSKEFQQMAAQGRNQQLAAAEATGSLGAMGTQNSLASIAPQLGLQAYQQQLQNQTNLFGMAQGAQQNYLQSLGNLVGIGQSAAAGQAAAGQNYANNAGQLMQGMGAIQAGRANQPSRAQGALTGAATGAATGAMIGSVVPGVGTAFGAIAGGVVGGLGSLL